MDNISVHAVCVHATWIWWQRDVGSFTEVWKKTLFFYRWCQNQVTPTCLQRHWVRLHEENVDYGFRIRFYCSEWHSSRPKKTVIWLNHSMLYSHIGKKSSFQSHSKFSGDTVYMFGLVNKFTFLHAVSISLTMCHFLVQVSLFQFFLSENIWLWLINISCCFEKKQM